MKISIASGKGGTGKTTVATNLASLISEYEDVLLIDLDVEEPNSGLFISGEEEFSRVVYRMIPEWDASKCTLCGKCQELCSFNSIVRIATEILVFKELCHSCYACSELCPEGALPMKANRMGVTSACHSGKLVFVESKLDIGQEQAVPLISSTKEIIDEYPGRRIIISDSPPGTSCPVIEATKDSDLVILVTEPTPFGMHDLMLAVETMKVTGNRHVVVINRYGIGDSRVEDYCRKEGIEVIARIPDDRRVAEIYSRGALPYKEVPSFRDEICRIRDYIDKFIAGNK